MSTSNLSYAQAEAAMSEGKFVALPEWGGLWFRMPEGVKALTIPTSVAKAWTGESTLTDRTDWKIVEGLISFGTALTVLKAGFAIRRKDWPVEDYVFIRPADVLEKSIVGVVKSLPVLVKALLYRNFKQVTFTEYFCKAQGNNIQNGWLPSAEELLAGDWLIATDVR